MKNVNKSYYCAISDCFVSAWAHAHSMQLHSLRTFCKRNALICQINQSTKCKRQTTCSSDWPLTKHPNSHCSGSISSLYQPCILPLSLANWIENFIFSKCQKITLNFISKCLGGPQTNKKQTITASVELGHSTVINDVFLTYVDFFRSVWIQLFLLPPLLLLLLLLHFEAFAMTNHLLYANEYIQTHPIHSKMHTLHWEQTKKKYVANSLTRQPLSKRWKMFLFFKRLLVYYIDIFAYYISELQVSINKNEYKIGGFVVNGMLLSLAASEWTEMNISHCVGSCLMKTGSTCTTIHLFFDWILI